MLGEIKMINEMLPIGTIVKLKNAEKNLMIFGTFAKRLEFFVLAIKVFVEFNILITQ